MFYLRVSLYQDTRLYKELHMPETTLTLLSFISSSALCLYQLSTL